jgi:hypothetical protein
MVYAIHQFMPAESGYVGTFHLEDFCGQRVGDAQTFFILFFQLFSENESCHGGITGTGTIYHFDRAGVQACFRSALIDG